MVSTEDILRNKSDTPSMNLVNAALPYVFLT